MSNDELFKTVELLAGDFRAPSFRRAAELAVEFRCKHFVETGCFRGITYDGQSTRILGMLAVHNGGRLDSVDIDPGHVAKAKKFVSDIYAVSIHQHDAVSWLSARVDPIDFLYLDSYDYEPSYPPPAQIHQVAEMGAAFGKLLTPCVVLLDDCNIVGGGKGLLTDLFLKERGFKLEYDGYQKLFVR